MRLLLDTHVVLWTLHAAHRLSRAAREAIAASDSLAAISAASIWEIAIKHALGRLSIDEGFEAELVDRGFVSLPITFDHAIAAGQLPRHHRDPFDRMLIAQAQLEGMTLVSADRRMSLYAVHTLAAVEPG